MEHPPPLKRHTAVDIQVTDLTYAYGKKAVLENVNFTLRPARIYGLIGENGSGKTTLLSLLAGILRPQSGCLANVGNPGLLLQGTGFYRNLSVRENLQLFALETGVDGAAIDTALKFTGYPPERYASPYRTLSQGYKQRLAIARSFLTDGNLILLDEPFTAVDLPTVRILKKAIRDYVRATGKTVLIASHQLREVRDLLDGTLILREGAIATVEHHPKQATSPTIYISFAHGEEVRARLIEYPHLRVLRAVDTTFEVELLKESTLSDLLAWLEDLGLQWTSIERHPPLEFLFP